MKKEPPKKLSAFRLTQIRTELYTMLSQIPPIRDKVFPLLKEIFDGLSFEKDLRAKLEEELRSFKQQDFLNPKPSPKREYFKAKHEPKDGEAKRLYDSMKAGIYMRSRKITNRSIPIEVDLAKANEYATRSSLAIIDLNDL